MSTPDSEPRVVAQRYQLQSMLGGGSMGTVWSAYDSHLQRTVAIKEVRMPTGFPETVAADLRERTMREARAIAMLAHPNVIVLHDVAHEDGDPFVVMELVAGRSVADLVATHGPLHTAQAAAIADAVAAALETAHNAGITHRDVKPGNVLLGGDGQIKLTDFGIARNVSEDTMTGTGVTLGSPAYIAPEVAAGADTSTAADLWGLGAMLFTAVEGVPPYDVAGDPLETVGQVVHGTTPRPSPGPLAETISSLMVKEPAQRTPLSNVREQVFPLLDSPVHTLFPPRMLGISDPAETDAATGATGAADPTAEPRENTVSRAASEQPPASNAPDDPAAGANNALAQAPGPLPFTPAGQADTGARHLPEESRRRGTVRRGILALGAVVLFLLAAVGGFAGTRVLGGHSLSPPPVAQSTPHRTPTTPTFDLVSRDGDASNPAAGTTAEFSIDVPRDWRKFVAGTTPGQLPGSTLVQFVSPDGIRTLTVQHYPDYFPRHDTDDYLPVLRDQWDSDDFVLARQSSPPSGEGELTFTYRTVQHAESTAAHPRESVQPTTNHTTIARLFRVDNSLWVVDVTVPTEQETSARSELFDRIVSTFRTTD